MGVAMLKCLFSQLLLLFLTEMTSPQKTTSTRIKVIGDPVRRANPDVLHAPGITASMDVITIRGPVTLMHQLTRDKFYKVMNCLQTDEQLTLTPQTKVIHISKLFPFICMYRQWIDYIIKLTASKIKSWMSSSETIPNDALHQVLTTPPTISYYNIHSSHNMLSIPYRYFQHIHLLSACQVLNN